MNLDLGKKNQFGEPSPNFIFAVVKSWLNNFDEKVKWGKGLRRGEYKMLYDACIRDELLGLASKQFYLWTDFDLTWSPKVRIFQIPIGNLPRYRYWIEEDRTSWPVCLGWVPMDQCTSVATCVLTNPSGTISHNWNWTRRFQPWPWETKHMIT